MNYENPKKLWNNFQQWKCGNFHGDTQLVQLVDRSTSHRGPYCWRQHGPLERWYPTTKLHGVHNSDEIDLNLHRRENLKSHFISVFLHEKSNSCSFA
jgi:hypothetical protein